MNGTLVASSTSQQEIMIKTRKANVNEFSHKTELSSQVLSGRQSMQKKLPVSPERPDTQGVCFHPKGCFYPQLKSRPGGTGRHCRVRKTRNWEWSPGLRELSPGSCPGALPKPGLHCYSVHCAEAALSPVCTSSPSSPAPSPLPSHIVPSFLQLHPASPSASPFPVFCPALAPASL